MLDAQELSLRTGTLNTFERPALDVCDNPGLLGGQLEK